LLIILVSGLIGLHAEAATAAALASRHSPTLLGRGDISAGQTEGKYGGDNAIEPLLTFHVKSPYCSL
jgi:hypothetical protein